MSADWYVMRAIPGKETDAVMILEKKIERRLWIQCRILKKQQLFRSQGRYLLSRKELFPGYVFIETETPENLMEELQKAKKFPQIIGNRNDRNVQFVPVEEKDLWFLKNVCGRELEHDMWLSTVRVDGEGRVESATGALRPYLGRITRQRLRHRYVTAEVPLFNRVENILFGIRIKGDPL